MLSSPVPSDVAIKANPANWLLWIIVPIFTLAGIVLRFAGLKFLSIDMQGFLLGWYDELAMHGFAALREPFSDYTPAYLYLLFLTTKTAGLIPKVAAIKLFSIGFDFLNAFLIYKVLRIRFPQGTMPWIGASAFLLLPTVLVNSAYWGQCDSIYTFFILACLLFLMREQPLVAMIFFGIAFAFKAQASFLAPFLLLLVIKKRIPWLYLSVVPLVYILMVIPAAVVGRPLLDLLTIYARQTETYPALSMHAPNLYLLLPSSLNTGGIMRLALLITIIVALVWIRSYAGKIREVTPQAILLCALMSVVLMPFFLPKMHERYFYLADIISLLMAFFFRRGWLLTIGYQLISGFTYSIFLLPSVIRMTHIVAGNLLISAVFINIALMGFIFFYPGKLIDSNVNLKFDTSSHDT